MSLSLVSLILGRLSRRSIVILTLVSGDKRSSWLVLSWLTLISLSLIGRVAC